MKKIKSTEIIENRKKYDKEINESIVGYDYRDVQ